MYTYLGKVIRHMFIKSCRCAFTIRARFEILFVPCYPQHYWNWKQKEKQAKKKKKWQIEIVQQLCLLTKHTSRRTTEVREWRQILFVIKVMKKCVATIYSLLFTCPASQRQSKPNVQIIVCFGIKQKTKAQKMLKGKGKGKPRKLFKPLLIWLRFLIKLLVLINWIVE